MDVRLRSPPEIPFLRLLPILVSQQSISPSWSIRAFTRRYLFYLSTFSFIEAENIRLSRGVIVSIRISSCMM